jgi:hypothetical protein
MTTINTSSSSLTLDEVFLEAFKKAVAFDSFSAETRSYIKDLAKQQKADFASPMGGYFSLENQEKISQEAALRLSQALQGKSPQEIGISEVRGEWQKIVADFYRQNAWGYTTQKQKPPKVLTKDQKIARELTPYIWAAFQAWVVMKIVIYYFGLDAADNPDESHVFLYIGLGFSFCSLVFFAWRKSKKGD